QIIFRNSTSLQLITIPYLRREQISKALITFAFLLSRANNTRSCRFFRDAKTLWSKACVRQVGRARALLRAGATPKVARHGRKFYSFVNGRRLSVLGGLASCSASILTGKRPA